MVSNIAFCEDCLLAALALEAARGPDVFLLRCGRAPEAGFEEAGDFLAKNTKDRLRAAPESFLEQLFPSLAAIAGLIASRYSTLCAPRGSLSKAGFVAPAMAFRARARRVT
jgi:hypothetical protein